MAQSLNLAIDVLDIITNMNARQDAIGERRFLGLLPRKVVPFNNRPADPEPRQICPNWTGYWLQTHSTNYGFREQPAPCSKLYCPTCGPQRRSHIMRNAAIGVTHAYPKARFALMTLTYQTRRWYRRGYVIEPWQAFMRRHNIDQIPRLPSDWDSMERRQQALWFRQQPEPHQVMLRAQLTPKQWHTLASAQLFYLWSAWQRMWGEKPIYYLVWELTQQGTPHLHIVYHIPAKATTYTLRRWLERTWARILGITSFTPQVDVGRDFKGDPFPALDYALKYASKDGYHENAWYAASYRQLTGDTTPIDWNKGVRRRSKSNNWPVAISGELDCFRTTAGTPLNLHAYRRAYGRFYYHFRLKDHSPALYGDPVFSNKAVWASTGSPDALGVNTLKFIGTFTVDITRQVLYAAVFYLAWRQLLEARAVITSTGISYNQTWTPKPKGLTYVNQLADGSLVSFEQQPLSAPAQG